MSNQIDLAGYQVECAQDYACPIHRVEIIDTSLKGRVILTTANILVRMGLKLKEWYHNSDSNTYVSRLQID